jgi:serine/threonine protein kinase
VTPSAYGVDLSEYIANGFFAEEAHQAFARAIAIQLAQGLEHVGKRNVIMRDVKSDNVLIECEARVDGSFAYSAKWSDYGLAVHLGDGRCDGQGLRSPDALFRRRPSGCVGGLEVDSADARVEALIGFWYVREPTTTFATRSS